MSDQSRPGSFITVHRSLLLVLLLALVLRVALLQLTAGHVGLTGDEQEYLRRGTDLANSGYYESAWRTPIYPYLLAAIFRLAGPSTYYASVLNILASLGSITILYFLTGRLFGYRAGLIAAAIFASDPVLVAFDTYLWTESLYMFAYLGLMALALLTTRMTVKRAAVLGLIFGLTLLVKPALQYFVVVLAVWIGAAWGGNLKTRAARMAVFCGVALVVLSPWLYRNYTMLGSPVLTTNGGFTLWRGNDTTIQKDKITNLYFAIPGEMQREQVARSRGMAAIKSRQPLWLFQKLWQNMPALLGPDNFVLRKVREGAYAAVSPMLRLGDVGLTGIYYLLATGVGILGLVAAPLDRRRHYLAALFFVYFLAIHTAITATTRMRLEFLPLLYPFAGYFLANVRSARWDLSKGSHRWLAISALVLFIVVAGLGAGPMLDTLAG